MDPGRGEERRGMDFGDAIRLLRCSPAGSVKLTRRGWNGKGMWVHRYNPGGDSPSCRTYIEMFTADSAFVPWVASQTDMLATDWEICGTYTGLPLMTFSDVLYALKAEPDARFGRVEWADGLGDLRTGKGPCIGMRREDGGMCPFLYFEDKEGWIPFTPGPNSLFADDWYRILEDEDRPGSWRSGPPASDVRRTPQTI